MGLLREAARHKEERAASGAEPAAPPGPASAGGRGRIHGSITAKLILIVSILLVFSTGAITVMVSYLLSADVGLTAEDNNYSVNKRNAAFASLMLEGFRSAARVFLFDPHTEADAALFFAGHPEIACLAVARSGAENLVLRNAAFFNAYALDDDAPERALSENEGALARAGRGEVSALNASAAWGTPVAALFFPMPGGAAAVYFSASAVVKGFGDAAEGGATSFVINDAGDILCHPDETLVSGGANVSSIPFVRNMLENNSQNIQSRYVDESGEEYIAAYQRIDLSAAGESGGVILVTIVPSKAVFRGIVATARQNVIVGAGVLCASIVVVVLFSRALTRPLKRLTRAARQIEAGDYNLSLAVESRDEIGVLTESFIGMSHSIANFERFTNKPLVRLARAGALGRTAGYKEATICFAFIRDFDDMTRGLRAKTIVDFANDFLERVVPCVSFTGGIVDKFLTQNGVVVMALWGVAESAGAPGRDALNCVRACLMMRIALFDMNEERYEQFWGRVPRIKMGCGINSGRVVAGQIGSEERMEYTAIGDAVNLAARLEGPNDLFDTDMLISESTNRLVEKHVLTSEMPSISVKGKAAPVRLFSVVNMRDISDSVRLFEEYQSILKQNVAESTRRKIRELAAVDNIDELRKILANFRPPS